MIEDAEPIIEEFLEGAPRAQTWGELRQALAQRLEEAYSTGDTRRIKELEQQVAALAQEEAITRFVEDSLRVTIARPRAEDFDDEF